MLVRVFFIFGAVTFISTPVYTLSGYFGDDGVGQTVLKKSIHKSDYNLVKKHLLELLDLPDRPEKKPARKSPKVVPKYLWKIYERLSKYDDGSMDSEPIDGISHEHSKIIELSDTVMTFLNKRSSDASNDTRLMFDLSEVSTAGLDLLMSEIRFFKWRLPEKKLASNRCVIKLFASVNVNGVTVFRHVGTNETTVGFQGPIQIDFTKPFAEWIMRRMAKNIIHVTMEYEDGMGNMQSPSVDISYLLNYDDIYNQPVLLAYYENDDHESHISQHQHLKYKFLQEHHRSKRSTHTVNPFDYLRSRAPVNEIKSDRPYDPKSKVCQRHAMVVTFKQLRWNDWIFAPNAYPAFYCSGTCDFPFPHHVEATNHAVIQQLARLVMSHQIPKPCCAPSQLKGISLLYSTRNSRIFMKRYRDMMAMKCACQ